MDDRAMTFQELFPAEISGAAIDRHSPEALAPLDYSVELGYKNLALQKLLAEFPAPAPIVPSPLPRNYRTTTKRAVTAKGGKVQLHFARTPGRELVALSVLEPESHGALYRFLAEALSHPRHRAAASVLNYLIIRGSYAEHALIFNVRKLSGDVIRSLRCIAENAGRAFPALRSAFLYLDESASDYYLEAERPVGKLAFKKLFGPETLALKLAGRKFLYPVTVFSQINESILPQFFEVLRREVMPQSADQFLDLYCGYGLWSLLLAKEVQSVWGAELSREAVNAARDNAAYHHPGKKMHFECAAITAEVLAQRLPRPRNAEEVILLDPPRQGCAPGVLETLIGRHPRRILHLFCGADEIAPALGIYRANGCTVKALYPFDFFPGSMNVEVLAVIQPGAGKKSSERKA